MNRRSFLADMLKAGVGAMILPPAVTYARHWKPTPAGILTCRDFSTWLVSTHFMFDDLGRKMLEEVVPFDPFTLPLPARITRENLSREFMKTFFSPNNHL